MPQVPELVNVILFFVPGLLLMQTLYLGGIGRGRSSLDRIIWGIVLSIPIRWVADQLMDLLGLDFGQGLLPEIILMGLALVIGVLVGFILKEEKEEEQHV
ncbi:MAG: hypothetical protein U9R15_00445 [Chloroflexota bacterium]|nr:hypothetical protein [Chloroflexota bacterium]